MKRHVLFIPLLALAMLLLPLFSQISHAAPAAKWPDPKREFTLVAPYNPGGQVDAQCRISAPYLEKYLGMKVLVQNIPGSGGLVGTNSIFAGKNDGYTAIYTSTLDGIWAFKHLSPTAVPWKLSDWKGTGIYASMGVMGMACMKDKPWKDFADFIEDAKKNPPKTFTVASMGPGRLDDLWVIEMQKFFGVEFKWVFYDGSGSIQTDMLTGDIDAAVIGVTRSDFLDHPKFRVLTGLVEDYPEGCPYKGVYPTLKDFEKRLGYTMQDLPALSIKPVWSFIVKSNIPDEAYQAICRAIRQMCEDPNWQKEIKAIHWPTYIPPTEQDAIFAETDKVIASYVALHKQYVER